jgi:glycosyltransferase involved in cell wall biosynthesis
MKILFDNHMPFLLAHGGAQTQVEETMRAVAGLGIEVEPLRWWDERQAGNLVHFFGLPGGLYSTMAHTRGIPVVATILLTSNCNHPTWRLRVQGLARRIVSGVPGGRLFRGQTNWGDYACVDRFVVGLQAEKRVLEILYGVSGGNISIVPLGLAEEFRSSGAAPRGSEYLVTSGTITDRKRSVDLARMAIEARVSVLFLGKPYSEDDPYWKEFQSLVDGKYVLHHGHVDSQPEMIRLLKSARGFVIFSRHENWCLSAHEAAACGLPILVQDQPWSRERFGSEASYLVNGQSAENPTRLRDFYNAALSKGPPAIQHHSWLEVAGQLKTIYEKLLAKG